MNFYLTLPYLISDSSVTLYNFTLPQPIHTYGEWDVALAEIVYPNTYDNVRDCYLEFLTLATRPSLLGKDEQFNYVVNVKLSIANGYYSSITQLINAIQKTYDNYWIGREEELQKALGIEDLLNYTGDYDNEVNYIGWARKTFSVSYDNEIGRVKMNFKSRVSAFVKTLNLSPNLRDALGFENRIFKHTNGEVTALRPPNLNANVSYMYVYTSLITPQPCSDLELAQLLRIVPLQGEYGTHTVCSFNSLHYIPVMANRFDTVDFLIKDRLGKTILFNSGSVILKLHFRQK